MTGGRFTWNGVATPFRAGQTVAQALNRAGIVRFGSSTADQPRGVFCGIGQCRNCLVMTRDSGPKEACLLLCRDGLELCSIEGPGDV